jgi:hypothetical protein
MSPPDPKRESNNADSELARQAAAPAKGIVGELWGFMRDNKKWWLAPILIVLLLLGALIFLAGTSAAPFIYTLF